MSRQVRAQPVLTFRRIVPVDILKKFEAGEYDDMKIVPSNTVPTPGVAVFDRGIHVEALLDKKGSTIQFVQANPSSESEGHRCKYCELPFKGKGFGRPVSLTFSETSEGRRVKVYTTVDSYNSLECMKTDYFNSTTKPANYRKPHSVDGDALVRQMIYDCTGSWDIRDAYDPRLLKTKGGSMAPEEYLKSNYDYVERPELVLLPASVRYMRLPKT